MAARSQSVNLLATYLDPSGAGPESDVHCVAGFIASCEQWRAFNEAWLQRLEADNLSWFHMTDFESYQGEFQGWSRDRHKKLLSDLLSIVEKHTMASVGYGVSREMYQREVSEEVKRVVGKSPYFFLFMQLVLTVEELMKHLVLYTPFDPNYKIAYLLAHGDVGSGTIVSSWMAGLPSNESLRHELRMESVRVVEDNFKHPPLQTSDILSYEGRKQIELQMGYHQRPSRYPLARIEDFRQPHKWGFYQHAWHLRRDADSIARAVLGQQE